MCHEVKPLAEFPLYKAGKHGLAAECRTCRNIRFGRYRAKKRATRPDYIVEGVQMKRCTRCAQVKPLDTFNRSKKGKHGYASECRECSNTRRRVTSEPKAATPAPLKYVPSSMHSHRAQITAQVESGLWQDERASRLGRLLSQICYDDALVCGEWRLELLYLERGLPHFRLYWNGLVFGVARIFAQTPDLGRSRHTPVVCMKLAAYLVALGWQAENIQMLEGGALTDLSAPVQHQYSLFNTVLDTPAPRVRVYDLLRDSIAS